MHRRPWLLAAALAAALAGGSRLLAQGAGDVTAELQARALAAAMPPGSEFRYDRVDTDPADGAVRFTNLAVRLGPEAPTARRGRAAELSLAGLPEALARGRIAALRARDLLVEDATGRLGLASLSGSDIVPAALVAFFAGRPFQGPAAGRVALEGLAFGSGAETIAVTRAGWESLGDQHLAGFAVQGLVIGGADGRLEAQHLALSSLDWSRVDLERLAAARARVDALSHAEGARTPDEEAELAISDVEMALDLAGGELGGLDLDGLAFAPTDPAGPATRLGRLTVAELSRRRFGPSSLDSLAVADPEAQVGLAGLHTDTVLDRLPLEEMRAAVDALPRSEEGLRRLPGILDGVEGHGALGLASLAVTRTTDGAGLSLAHLDLTVSGTADRSAAILAIGQLTLDLARLAGGEVGRHLAESGLERLSARLHAGLTADTPAGRLSLDSLALDLDRLGALEATAELAEPQPGPDPVAALAGLDLVRAQLAYTDRSLLHRLFAGMMGGTESGAAVMADYFALTVSDPARTPWLDPPSRTALADFLRRPGRLEMSIAPPAPLPAGRIAELAISAPAALAAALGLTIRASPPR